MGRERIPGSSEAPHGSMIGNGDLAADRTVWPKDGYAYVRDGASNTVRVGTAVSARGTKYVRTYRDKVWTDNLLALPECA